MKRETYYRIINQYSPIHGAIKIYGSYCKQYFIYVNDEKSNELIVVPKFYGVIMHWHKYNWYTKNLPYSIIMSEVI